MVVRAATERTAPQAVAMGRRKVTTTVYFDPDQVAALEALACYTGRTAAELVREGVDLVLARHGFSRAGPAFTVLDWEVGMGGPPPARASWTGRLPQPQARGLFGAKL